jgi:hypothetical protein
MERMTGSPLAVHQAHLELGELAYQWSPEANKTVFYPRVICPFTGSDRCSSALFGDHHVGSLDDGDRLVSDRQS